MSAAVAALLTLLFCFSAVVAAVAAASAAMFYRSGQTPLTYNSCVALRGVPGSGRNCGQKGRKNVLLLLLVRPWPLVPMAVVV